MTHTRAMVARRGIVSPVPGGLFTMLARNAVVLGLGAVFAFAVGCGAPVDGTSKNNQQVGGSPNDPGWTPPGPNPGQGPDDTTGQPGDDQGEQPTGNPSCSTPAPAVTTPDGWTMRTFANAGLSTMSMATPSDWPTPTSSAGSANVNWFQGSADNTLGAGMMSVLDRTSLDEEYGTWHAVLVGKSGVNHTVARTDMTLGCDPAMKIVGMGLQMKGFLVIISVLHNGHVYTADCGGSSTTDMTMCDQMLATFRVTD